MVQNNYKVQPNIPKKSTSSNEFILDRRIKITIGLFLQGISIFLAFSFFSHFIHGAKDQHIVESFHIMGLKVSSMSVYNWLGFIGAFVSYYCVHVWWGITSFIFLPFLFLIGLKMIRQKIWTNLSLFKSIIISIFLVLWSNILLGYIYTLYPNATLLVDDYIGGVGYELGNLFKKFLGYGTFIFLFITLIIFIVVFFNITSLPMINLLIYKKKMNKDIIENFYTIIDSSFQEKKKYILVHSL